MKPRSLMVVGFTAMALFAYQAYAFAQSAEIDSLTANNRPLDTGGSGGVASGGGDLWFDLACIGGAYATSIDDPSYVNIELYLDGQLLDSQWFFGWGWSSGRVSARVRASIQDRRVECDAFGGSATATASGTLLGSGPGSATLKIDAFIRQNWVGDPGNVYRIFGGDDRWFSYYQDVSGARLTTVYDVLNPAVNDGDVLSGPTSGAGLTEEYDIGTSLDAVPPYGRLTANAKNDWVWDYPLKTRWDMVDTSGMGCSLVRLGPGQATSSHQIHCTANASNPLLWLAPGIQWDLTVTLTYGLDKIQYSVTGCHGYFPAFEMYVNASPLLQDPGSESPSDLLYGCGFSVSTSGEIR